MFLNWTPAPILAIRCDAGENLASTPPAMTINSLAMHRHRLTQIPRMGEYEA